MTGGAAGWTLWPARFMLAPQMFTMKTVIPNATGLATFTLRRWRRQTRANTHPANHSSETVAPYSCVAGTALRRRALRPHDTFLLIGILLHEIYRDAFSRYPSRVAHEGKGAALLLDERNKSVKDWSDCDAQREADRAETVPDHLRRFQGGSC